MAKKRIAVWLHGGIGTGHFSQGFSVLEKIVSALTASFEIVVYSQAAPNPAYIPKNFELRYPPQNGAPGWRRWLSLIRLFRHDHKRLKFDLIFAFWGYPAGFLTVCLARWFGISSVVYLLGSDTAGVKSVNHGVFHKPLTRRIALWTYVHASRLIVLVDYQRKQLEQHGLRRKVDMIPWGIDAALFYPSGKARTSTLHLLQVAHLNPVKDQPTLLKTFALILKSCPAELRIMGVDTLDGKIQRLAADLGIAEHIQFMEMQPYEKMPEHYRWADVLIQTSLSEGQGLAVSEAAASGVLLAGTRVGLLADLGETAAILAEPADAENLAAQIVAIAGDQKAWQSKTSAAKQWAKDHPFDRTIAELTALLGS